VLADAQDGEVALPETATVRVAHPVQLHTTWITRPLPSGGALEPGIAIGAVDIHPEVKLSAIWFSETGEGSWRTPQDGGPDTFDIDRVTASEVLADLASLHA